MPFIRYRTGDIGYLFSGICGCGSMIRRILPFGGRRNGKSITAGTRRLTQWELDEILFSVPGVIDYGVREDPGHPGLTVYGVERLDTEKIRKLLSDPKMLGGSTAGVLEVTAKVKEGFAGDGMRKRSISAPEEGTY